MSGEEMRPYVVRQGDYLTKLAWVHGFDAEEVWKHEKNKELADRRKDHNVLAPGDVLYIPVKKNEGLPIQKGVTNRYVAKVPRVSVTIALREGDAPLGGEPYVLRGFGEPIQGTTTSEGQISAEIPVHVAEVSVVLPHKCRSYRILVGHMDPIAEPSGVRRRLAHLGHFGHSAVEDPSTSEAAEEGVRDAITDFQVKNDLPPIGVMDDATRDAVSKAHLW